MASLLVYELTIYIFDIYRNKSFINNVFKGMLPSKSSTLLVLMRDGSIYQYSSLYNNTHDGRC